MPAPQVANEYSMVPPSEWPHGFPTRSLCDGSTIPGRARHEPRGSTRHVDHAEPEARTPGVGFLRTLDDSALSPGYGPLSLSVRPQTHSQWRFPMRSAPAQRWWERGGRDRLVGR